MNFPQLTILTWWNAFWESYCWFHFYPSLKIDKKIIKISTGLLQEISANEIFLMTQNYHLSTEKKKDPRSNSHPWNQHGIGARVSYMITFTDKITTQNDHKIIQKTSYSESTETNVLEKLYEGDWAPIPLLPREENDLDYELKFKRIQGLFMRPRNFRRWLRPHTKRNDLRALGTRATKNEKFKRFVALFL